MFCFGLLLKCAYGTRFGTRSAEGTYIEYSVAEYTDVSRSSIPN